ncbi:TRAP transporter substrate-binding protein [Actimicrobium sp. CCC2.4]|uniref:TRAP transporter substrate-binding protein n=1 Tax=Actimicrobium sp. CCC2.4 TaxID=3048606 RepID=UPI002AC9173A|nr:TRAP transporter substrate-binding protein [Actimicrobium sp. CCC2.4]MEB0134624.1 TRAP transporter substrate-binding protein [Actimicrobium sp. CCC2.4]WPX30566.1 TRAP transporter substrate-binding protein [Actimicrobium sp. CCC2.4]
MPFRTKEDRSAQSASQHSRRDALKLIAGVTAATLIPSAALAQGAGKFNLKIAITLPESHPTSAALKAACVEITKESNGRLIMEVYPNGQLGSDTDTLSQVRSGAIDFICTAGSIYGNLAQAASINSIAFAFPDYPSVWKAMEGDLGAHIRTALDKVNLTQVGKFFDHGFRQITHSSKPIVTPRDLADMKIRVPATPLWTSMFKALNASPTSVPIGELYTALQTKVVDGQENALPTIDAAKLYEVQKYCSNTSHLWEYFALVGNKRIWNALPEDLRALVTKVFDANAIKQRAAHESLNVSLEAKLKGLGMQFNRVDTKPFREVLLKAGYYEQWQKKFGPETWAQLEKYTGKLG